MKQLLKPSALLTLLLSIFLGGVATAQALTLEVKKNGTWVNVEASSPPEVCPSPSTYTYRIVNYSHGCHEVSFSASSNEQSNTASTALSATSNEFEIVWQNLDVPNRRVTVTKSLDTDCTDAAISDDFEVMVRAIEDVTPVINCPVSPLAVGSSAVVFSASAEFADGPNGNPTQITTFNWTVPAGWTIISGAGTGTITVTPSLYSGGTVSVVATHECGNSQSAGCMMSRYIPSPCPMSTSVTLPLVCLRTKIFGASVGTSQYAGMPVVFTWSVDLGLTLVNSSGASAGIKPNGSTPSNIKVRASITGSGLPPSDFCIKPVTYTPISDSAKVVGLSHLCTTGTYTLTNPPPTPGTTWQVVQVGTGPFPVSPASGNGIAANLTSLISGQFQIKFTVYTPCGSAVVTSPIYSSGVPYIKNIKVDGTIDYYTIPVFVTWNQPTSTHWVTAQVTGSTSNCLTWSQNGSNFTSYSSCNEYDIVFTGANQQANIVASSTNACGTVNKNITIITNPGAVGGGGGTYNLLVSPNPAFDYINVSASLTDQAKESGALPSEYFEAVRIFDESGNIVYTSEKQFLETVIPVHNLQQGKYTLRATISGKSYVQLFQVFH